MKKLTSLLLLVLLLAQSCVVYQKVSVPIEDAYDQGRVKMITKSGDKMIFNKIIFANNVTYFGVTGRKTISNILIDPNNIESIYLQNKKKSTVGTILVLIPISLLVAWLILAAMYAGV